MKCSRTAFATWAALGVLSMACAGKPPPLAPSASDSTPRALSSSDDERLARSLHIPKSANLRFFNLLGSKMECEGATIKFRACFDDDGRPCAECQVAKKFLVDSVRRGHDDAWADYEKRWSKPLTLPLDGVGARGPEDARHVLVEYIDLGSDEFLVARKLVDAAVAAKAGEIRLVSHLAPRRSNYRSDLAGRAAIAAANAGKYWEMRDALAEQSELTEAGVLALANKLGIAEARFRQSLEAPETHARLAREAERAGRGSGQRLYINGRRYLGQQSIAEWLATDEEMAARGKVRQHINADGDQGSP